MRPWDANFKIIQELSQLIDEHVEWYDRIIGVCLHPGEDLPENIQNPERSLIDFLETYKNKKFWSQRTHDGLINHYQKLVEDAANVCVAADNKKHPSADICDAFRGSFLNFMFLINKVKDHTTLHCFGIEPYSGLKTKKQALVDIKKEAERKIRMDVPHCILIMRIDNLHEVEDIFGRSKTEIFIRKVAEIIENKLRILDDMYRMEDNEFLISVKLTDKPGALLFAQRMQTFFSNPRSVIKMDEYDIQVKLSFVMAEPMPGENITKLLQYMKEEMAEKRTKDCIIITYNEKSAIERFASSLK